MTKLVNIKVTGRPITALNQMIRTNLNSIKLDVGDIQKILLQKGKVEEILDDGSIIHLNLSNYYLDNNKLLAKKKEEEAQSARQKELEVKQKKIIEDKRNAAKHAKETLVKKEEPKYEEVVKKEKVEVKEEVAVKEVKEEVVEEKAESKPKDAVEAARQKLLSRNKK